jgi:uncharacterized protein (DUF1501 family)
MSRMTRRRWLKATSLGLFGAGLSASGWLPALAADLAADPRRRRRCVLLWMNGGPSQLDTFDMKPGHENGGPIKEIETAVPGLRFSEHLPKLAEQADKLAVLRGLSTKEGDHGRGTYLMRTGHPPMGPVQFPTIGSSLFKELGRDDDPLPGFVSIAPYRAFNPAAFAPGFLGPRYGPLTVGATDVFQAQANQPAGGYAELRVDDLRPASGIDSARLARRMDLWSGLQASFLAGHPLPSPLAHDTVYRRAARLIEGETSSAFDLEEEPASVRDAYGKSRFGQGCLLARRLVERGVPFVEVTCGAFGGGQIGWDTHRNNFEAVKNLSAELDAGWATLMKELDERGLLESTTLLWMGEFGRTPKINQGAGRDHYPAAWTAVLAGGGIRGGQAHGRTSDDGMTVEEGRIEVGDLLATLCAALGVPPDRQNISDIGRPFRIAEGTPIRAVLA